MFSESRWKDSNRFYGTSENILFALAPELNIYRTSGGTSPDTQSFNPNTPNTNCSTNFQYLNMKTYGYPHGFGMGGHLEKFRFFIPDTMDDGSGDYKVCIAGEKDLTFEYGSLIPPRTIDPSKSSSSTVFGNNKHFVF